jgi:hypothetical protein
MTEYLPHIVAGLICFAAGCAVMAWIKSRPTTTKAMALKALAAEAELVAKMDGAAGQRALIEQEVAIEALAAKHAAVAIAKAAGGQS